MMAEQNQKLEQRIEKLLNDLTVEEKVSLCAGQSFWKTKAIPRLGIKQFKMVDGPRGVGFHSCGKRCTAFPSGIAQAATWNEELMEAFGTAIAKECHSVGARTILSPAINITRTPLNGRTFEYFSEDPYLNGRLSVPFIQGAQKNHVAACVKHFAVNNQETNRIRVSSEVSERAMEEIYLPAFKASVEKADAWSIMGAYNAVNGTAACENKSLMKDKLRGEYGFRGFVVSDWFAVRSTSSGAACIKAGLDLEMPGKGSKCKTKNLLKEFKAGDFTEEELNDSLRGLIRVMALTGHLDNVEHEGQRNTQEHQQLARKMAEDSITLLKNDAQILPLNPDTHKKVALIGPKLKKRNCLPLYGGSAGVWPPYEVTPFKGLEKENKGRFEFVESAENADVALVFVGLNHKFGNDSEGVDRKHMDLPEEQVQLVKDTLKKNENTVVILITGSPVSMPWVDQVPGILACWYPGMEGGTAIAKAIFGDVNPSGKLPVTFPKQLSDSPAHASERSFPGTKEAVYYDEELFVGYRHFDGKNIDPLFPFGHGLSYTEFTYSEISINADGFTGEDDLKVSLTVKNTGSSDGAEVVQLYIEDLNPGADRPPQTLKDFKKIELKVGEGQQVNFEVPMEQLRIFCPEKKQWYLKAGSYRVRLGSSSRDIRLEQNFEVYENQKSMNRRELIRNAAIVLGGIASSSVVQAMINGVGGRSNIESPIFTWDQKKMTEVLAELIIPETDTPGAIQAKVPHFIELMVSDWYNDTERKIYFSGLTSLNNFCSEKFGSVFLESSEDQKIKALENEEKISKKYKAPAGGGMPMAQNEDENKPFFNKIKELTVLGYFTSEEGATKELSYNPIPMEYGDIDFSEIGHQWSS